MKMTMLPEDEADAITMEMGGGPDIMASMNFATASAKLRRENELMSKDYLVTGKQMSEKKGKGQKLTKQNTKTIDINQLRKKSNAARIIIHRRGSVKSKAGSGASRSNLSLDPVTGDPKTKSISNFSIPKKASQVDLDRGRSKEEIEQAEINAAKLRAMDEAARKRRSMRTSMTGGSSSLALSGVGGGGQGVFVTRIQD